MQPHPRPHGRAPPQPTPAPPPTFNISQVQHLLNPVGASQSALPLPPLAAPLPFAPTRDERFGPQWEGGKEKARFRFERQWVPLKDRLRRAMRDSLAEFRAEGRALAAAKVAELEAGWRAEDEAQAQQEVDAAAARAAEFASAPAPAKDAGEEAGEKAEEAEAAAAPESLTAATARIAKAREAERAPLRAAAAAGDRTCVDNQDAAFGQRLLTDLLPLVKDCLRGGSPEAAVAYTLVRESRTHNVAPLLDALIGLTADPAAFVNAPLPTSESWLVHRACWDGNPLVVKALVARGAITSRLNEYCEHPLMVTHAAFTNRDSRCTLEAYNAIQGILADTYYRGLAAPAPAPADTASVLVRSGNPLWLQLLPTQPSDAQTHVYVSGIPFEYPMLSVLEWFANCGTVKHMYAPRAGSRFAAARRGEAAGPEAHTGSCVIVFATAAAAAKALEYDRYPLLRRVLHVTRAKPSMRDRLLWGFQLAAAKAKEEGLPAPRRPTRAALDAAVAAGRAKSQRAKAKRATAAIRRHAKLELEAATAGKHAAEAAAETAARALLGVDEAEQPMEAPAAPPGPPVVSEAPAWLATLPRGAAQRHVLLQGVPFEAGAEDVLAMLRAPGSPAVQQVYLPTRVLKAGSAHDEKLCAALGVAPGASVGKGCATVLLQSPADVVAALRTWDGTKVCGRVVRAARRKGDKGGEAQAPKQGKTEKSKAGARGGRRAEDDSKKYTSATPEDGLAMSGYQQSKRRAEEEAEAVLSRASKRQRIDQAEEGEVGYDEFIL
jgi:hypothetical protein